GSRPMLAMRPSRPILHTPSQHCAESSRHVANLAWIVALRFCVWCAGTIAVQERCTENGRILLANLLQSSRSTFSRGSFLSFFAFKEGMWDTQISALLSLPTVSGRFPPAIMVEEKTDLFC